MTDLFKEQPLDKPQTESIDLDENVILGRTMFWPGQQWFEESTGIW